MRIAFMGSDPIALPMLDFIYSDSCPDWQIEVVFTQPDRRTGRGMHVHANEIKTWAMAKALPVQQPRRCGEDDAGLLRQLKIDLLLVMAYGQILPQCILEAPSISVLNLHASLLPRLRGASPIHTAVAQGLDETGMSLMQIAPKLDAGPVADLEVVPIPSDATSTDVKGDLAKASVSLIRRSLANILSGELSFEEQNPDRVTYCRIIDKNDRHLDFNADARMLYNRIRAFQPWPGTAFPLDDTEIRIIQAEVVEGMDVSGPAGTVLRSGNSMYIVCGSHCLKPLVLQRPGGKAMPAEDFLRGHPIADNRILASREMRPLEQTKPFPYKKK